MLKIFRTTRSPDALDKEDIAMQQNKTLVTMRAVQVQSVLMVDFRPPARISG